MIKLIYPEMPEHSLVVLIGASGAGKSTLAATWPASPTRPHSQPASRGPPPASPFGVDMTSLPSPAHNAPPATVTSTSADQLRRMLDGLHGDVRALTVRQPFASCISLGAKDIENRSRSTRPRTAPVLLHAGMAKPSPCILEQPHVASTIGDRPLPTGVVLGLVWLTGSHPDDGLCTPWAMPDHHHWHLTGAWPLPEPVPARGQLSLWRPPATVLAAVRRQLTQALQATPAAR